MILKHISINTKEAVFSQMELLFLLNLYKCRQSPKPMMMIDDILLLQFQHNPLIKLRKRQTFYKNCLRIIKCFKTQIKYLIFFIYFKAK